MLKRILSLAIVVSLQIALLLPALADDVASNSDLDKGLAALQSRIEALKQGGTGVGPFQRIYDQIDGLAKAGKSEEASKLMTDLGSKLTTQENLRDQAKKLMSTRKVKVQQVTGAASSASTASTSADNSTGSPSKASSGTQAAASGASAAVANKSIKDKINCLRMHLQQMQANFGMPVGGFMARLNQAERLAPTSPWTASAEVDKIAADAERAVQARSK